MSNPTITMRRAPGMSDAEARARLSRCYDLLIAAGRRRARRLAKQQQQAAELVEVQRQAAVHQQRLTEHNGRLQDMKVDLEKLRDNKASLEDVLGGFGAIRHDQRRLHEGMGELKGLISARGS